MRYLSLRTTRGLVWAMAWLSLGVAPAAVAGEAGEFVEDFEGRWPVIKQGDYDGRLAVREHDLTGQQAHGGRKSEVLRFVTAGSTHAYFYLEIGKATVFKELVLSVWLRADRPGVKLLARVVFPKEVDPDTGQPRFALLKGPQTTRANRWEQLKLAELPKKVKQRQTLFRVQMTRAAFDVAGAYIDRLILDGPVGSGMVTLHVDDVRVAPFVGPRAQPSTAILSRPWGVKRDGAVSFREGRLKVGGEPFFPFGIAGGHLDSHLLRRYHFNTVAVDGGISPAYAQKAGDAGLWLAPRLDVESARGDTGRLDRMGQWIEAFPFGNCVVFWDLGGPYGQGDAEWLEPIAQAVRRADTNKDRALALVARNDSERLARAVPVVGADVSPLGRHDTLSGARGKLTRARLAGRPGSLFWTHVRAHPSAWHLHLAHALALNQAPPMPIGPDGEQLELLTQQALAAGARAILYTGDRYFTPAYHGGDRLAAVGLMGLRMEVLGTALAGGRPPEIVRGSIGTVSGVGRLAREAIQEAESLEGEVRKVSVPPNRWVEAGVVHYRGTTILLPYVSEAYSQYVVSGARDYNVRFTVPGVPEAARAWEISFRGVEKLQQQRGLMGTNVIIPEFDLTTVVVITTRPDLIQRLREQMQRRQPRAAELAIEQLLAKYEKVKLVHHRLMTGGHDVPNAGDWLLQAWKLAEQAKLLAAEKRHAEAYWQARLGLLALRRLQRAYWEDALGRGDRDVRDDLPRVHPYVLDFYALDQQYRLAERLRRAVWTSNLLSHGGFEAGPGPDKHPVGWDVRSDPEFQTRVRVPDVGRAGLQGNRMLFIQTEPKARPAPGQLTPWSDAEPGARPSAAPPKPTDEDDEPRVRVVSSAVPLRIGDVYRVTAYVKVPNQPPPGTPEDTEVKFGLRGTERGAIVTCSVGGEPMEFRTIDPSGRWRRVQFYRVVLRDPATHPIRVHLGLCGRGTAYFDDVRVERLVALRPPRKYVASSR